MQNTDTNTTTTATEETATSPANTESVSVIVPTAGETAVPVDQPVAAADPAAPAAPAADSKVDDIGADTTSPIPVEPRHDAAWYAKSAYECFIKNADPDTSDANPVAAIQRIFNQRASDELKAQCATEGKTAEGAYQFLWAVARLCKQTDGGCHISPETGYAIAMHYFQDVSAAVLDEFEPAMKKQKAAREAAEAKERAAKIAAEAKEKSKKSKEYALKSKTKKQTAKKAPKTPQDAPEPTPTTSSSGVDERSVATEGDAPVASSRKGLQPAAEKKPSKPTPPPSAQTTLFDALFA